MNASWNVDRPGDFVRLRASGLMPELKRLTPSFQH
jgi:hypothetical protein